jgi:hypothetical protein
MKPNPFTPTFGAPPPLLVGRRDVLDAIQDSLDEGPGSPGFVTLFTGGRGVGKTSMLNAAEDVARDAGFHVISETASAGLINRLTAEHLVRLLPKRRRGVKAVDIAKMGGLTLDDRDAPAPRSFRSLMDELTLKRPILITLDEIQGGVVSELRELAVVLQHSIREGRRFAFFAAGLPAAVDNLLNDDILTFLRRADRHDLGAVDLTAVKESIISVIAENGRTIAGVDAAVAAEATGGYPFMIQLVGYHSWRANRGRRAISGDDVAQGAADARRRVGRLVIEPALKDLSPVDKTFLLRMAVDDGPSKMADIAQRLDADSNYTSQYRLRLIAAGLIVPAVYGHVDFALPHLREWLREHGAFDT